MSTGNDWLASCCMVTMVWSKIEKEFSQLGKLNTINLINVEHIYCHMCQSNHGKQL